jgi:hypothetical protein
VYVGGTVLLPYCSEVAQPLRSFRVEKEKQQESSSTRLSGSGENTSYPKTEALSGRTSHSVQQKRLAHTTVELRPTQG